MSSIRIIYASTSGHAKYIANRLMESLVRASVSMSVIIDKLSAADSRPADLLDADILILVSADADGQAHLHRDMHALFQRANRIDFDERCVACVGLSTDRDTAKAITAQCASFIGERNGKECTSPLLLSGKDLYAYDREIDQWADKCISHVLHDRMLLRVQTSDNIF